MFVLKVVDQVGFGDLVERLYKGGLGVGWHK